MDGTAMRRFSGVLLDGEQRPFSLVAPSWADAVVLLNERYGEDCAFTLTDDEAAARPR